MYIFKKSKNYTRIKTEKLLIVIHWACCTGAQCVNWFLNPGCKVSSHYVLDRFGNVTQMVDEKYIAWHAGYSHFKNYPTKLGKTDWKSLNPCSIGIEQAGPPSHINKLIKKYNWDIPEWQGWPENQIQGLIRLCRDIKMRWPEIKLTDHSTIAPGRKSDVLGKSGIDLFPWERLLEETGIEEA